MPWQNQHINAFVLKKTKLSEIDLIITLLSEDGSQIRAVAKGARKPSSTFASRLELFSNVKVLLAKGKNLDIVRESRLIKAYSQIRNDIEKTVCASCAIELLEKVTQQNLCNSNLYLLTESFLNEVENIKDTNYLKALSAACLIKICTFIGFRPSLKNCVICNEKQIDIYHNINLKMNFSIEEGGVVCLKCSNKAQTEKISSSSVQLLHKLIHTKFDEIKLINLTNLNVDDVLEFCKKWILYHIGINLKSLALYIKNIK